MTGRIIKGIAGFYYVYVEGCGVYECKAKGVFRNRKVKPLVGDRVEIQVIDEAEHKGNMEEILPRTSELIRPAVANVDQAMVIFAAAKPKPNLSLLDRFLISMEQKEVPSIICFNKIDEASEEELQRLKEIYGGCGSGLLFISARYEQGVEEIRDLLRGKTTTVAGPSGVGKSTLVNALAGTEIMKTGEIREKDAKGRHTTTYREMIELPSGVIVIDTPGMREIGLCDVDEGIDDTFEDIAELAAQCRFRDCTHTNEPRCAVRQALENGQLSKERFELYRSLHVESRKSADMKAIAKARKALNKTRKR